MSEVLLAFGVLIAAIGIAAIAWPRGLLGLARRITVRTWLRVLAFVIRLVLGTILILVAPSTSFPLVIRLIGSLLVLSGIVVLLIGNQGIQRLVNRALGLSPPAVIVGGILGLAVGAFLIYLGW